MDIDTEPTVNTVPMVTIDTSDEITVPEPMYPPEPDQISENVTFKKVFCDIETTSFSMHTEIVQIAAVCEDETFDQYILPLRQLDPGASKVTGLTCDGGVLYHHGIAVTTIDLKSALECFLGWLDPLKPCVLVGHNFKNFDYPRIYRAFTKFNLINAFHQIVLGFVDSYPLFKAIYPKEESYKQESLVAKYVQETYDAHNAIGDVKSLKKLLTVCDKITHEVLCKYSFTANWYVEYHNYKTVSNKKADTFKQITENKILSKNTIDKIAGSGLEMKHLKWVYGKEGPEALTDLLVSRASLSKATVGKLLTFLASE
ncbi:maternal protein exuperantia-like [Mercenaria mercenaria]|uniref:maternal protein exuperantia-like n=1 Tax=Mercenaria mercenaria TaxID=6596 RepID=UPI00234EAEE1|nr:maternal protein exuperantia-like [Mercenaria mercenaria]